jgi:hypothetical protein
MKKIVVSLVLVCYLAVSSGVIINFHYCMNKLASTELSALESKQCGKCGMHTDKSHGCCRDEVKIVKMDEDQKITAVSSYVLSSLDALVHEPSDYIVFSFYNVPVTKHYQNHSPPLLSERDTYLQNGVFRI